MSHELQGGIPVDANSRYHASNLFARPAGLYVYTENTYYFKFKKTDTSWTALKLVPGAAPFRPIAASADVSGSAIGTGNLYFVYNGPLPD